MIEDELARANAHPAGARPFTRPEYVEKFTTLTDGLISQEESKRFLSLVEKLPSLSPEEVQQLNVVLLADKLRANEGNSKGIF